MLRKSFKEHYPHIYAAGKELNSKFYFIYLRVDARDIEYIYFMMYAYAECVCVQQLAWNNIVRKTIKRCKLLLNLYKHRGHDPSSGIDLSDTHNMRIYILYILRACKTIIAGKRILYIRQGLCADYVLPWAIRKCIYNIRSNLFIKLLTSKLYMVCIYGKCARRKQEIFNADGQLIIICPVCNKSYRYLLYILRALLCTGWMFTIGRVWKLSV